MKIRKLVLSVITSSLLVGCGNSQTLPVSQSPTGRPLPADVQAILGKEIYRGTTIAFKVEDLDTGEVIYEQNASELVQIASCRKLFSTGLALLDLGGDYRFHTPVYRQGPVVNGVLDGDLILVASGDFTMGARRGPNETLALTEYDHAEANNVGNAVANPQDPLAGYKDLAREVAASGITEVTGDIVIDDRLFQPFDFRGEYLANAVFVNDNLIDVQMSPTQVGQPAEMVFSPVSEAFSVVSTLQTTAGDAAPEVELTGGECFGVPGCQGTVSGPLSLQGKPVITGFYPLLQTFRINQPSNYARTVFIEALRAEGITVNADTVAANPIDRLPTASYPAESRVAELVSVPFQQYVNFIFKTSYNLGAEMSLMLFGLENGVRTQPQAAALEAEMLASEYGIMPSDYSFPDGHGGGETRASGTAVNTWLRKMATGPAAQDFKRSLTVIGSPGLLTTIPAISNNPTLRGAIGHIFAKSGTRGTAAPGGGVLLDTRASTGYIESRSGRRLIFFLAINDVGPIDEFLDFVPVFEDIDTITAIWWRDL